MKNSFILSVVLLATLSCSSFSQSSRSDYKPLPDSFKKYNYSPLGKNVFVFSPEMSAGEIQTVLDTLFRRQTVRGSEFTKNRYAVLFRPGRYKLDVRVDYYMHIMGLGNLPGDVVIDGAVRSNTTHGKSVLTNFWRSVENLTIIPSRDTVMVWGVSQAAPMRRVHVKGDLNLFDIGYASGGYLADSKIDGQISSGPQQQWFTRNTTMGKWTGGVWNMFFLGVNGAPAGEWPEKPFTVIPETPLVREKPFLSTGEKGLSVVIPQIRASSRGESWSSGAEKRESIPLGRFYIAHPEKDNSGTLNTVLSQGKNILFTPGIYSLDKSIRIDRKGTVVLGIGMATLMPVKGTPAIEVGDVGGVIISGLIVDAGPERSETLVRIGDKVPGVSHSEDPVFLHDIFMRVGGPAQGTTKSCLTINSNHTVVDHAWLWRADHGNGVGWDKNWCANGLIVNGADVTIYGLFNEHFHEYQTLWNGENGRVYFYQSEMPYDPPTVDSWKHGSTYGYASYKVADNVKNHEAWGIGIYNVFYDAPVIVDNAIETPPSLEDKIHNKVIFWLNGNKESYVKSIINGKGGRIDVNNRKAAMK